MAVSEAVKKYVEQLAQAAGTPDKATALLQVLDGDEKLAKTFEDELAQPRLRQSDYSRNMDALKTEKENYSKWYKGVLDTTSKNQKAVEEYEAKVTNYRQQLLAMGIDPDSPTGQEATRQAVPIGDYVSKKDLEELQKKQESQYLYLLKQVPTLAIRHFKQYGEELDMNALEKIVAEKNLPLDAAYRELTEPLAQKKQEQSFEERLKAAREEGLREGLSKANIPVDTRAKEPSVFRSAAQAKAEGSFPKTEHDRSAAFASAWNEAASGTKQ